MATHEEIRDEERRARHVRLIADYTCAIIMQTQMAPREAETLIGAARSGILALFPGREETYELLYAPRFRRVVEEFSRPDRPIDGGRVLPFPLQFGEQG